MREVILDTETTGLDPANGHRIVEVACLELVNHVPTGRRYQSYVNPERDMPVDALAVHGLTKEFLSDKPRFGEIVDALLEFVGDSPVVMHNAEFDLRFLHAECERIGRSVSLGARVIDTLQLARQKFPGTPASLDALCRRFTISNASREKHGALLDAKLLADVYLELMGGRQGGLDLSGTAAIVVPAVIRARIARPPRPHAATAEELLAHASLIAELRNPIWAW
jgi:DNA polymerase-3 subunit epsilon